MSEDNKVDVLKEIAKDVYEDAGRPVVKPTGELAGLVPRAVKAALAPLEKWILQREYNVAETQKLLEEKLKNVPSELIQPPEAHVAVPALQYISYCMDNDELRNMYANLLASSMISVVKSGVHPGFVEIIKQLAPDEAKILKYMFTYDNILPTITLRYVDEDGGGIDIIKNFSNVGELSKCENDTPKDISKYFDNLLRLGLIKLPGELSSLTNKNLYTPLKTHKYIVPIATDEIAKKNGFSKIDMGESFVQLSSYGAAFCSICLVSVKTPATSQNP